MTNFVNKYVFLSKILVLLSTKWQYYISNFAFLHGFKKTVIWPICDWKSDFEIWTFTFQNDRFIPYFWFLTMYEVFFWIHIFSPVSMKPLLVSTFIYEKFLFFAKKCYFQVKILAKNGSNDILNENYQF